MINKANKRLQTLSSKLRVTAVSGIMKRRLTPPRATRKAETRDQHHASPRTYQHINLRLVMVGVTSLYVYNPVFLLSTKPCCMVKNRSLRWRNYPRTVLSPTVLKATMPPLLNDSIDPSLNNAITLYEAPHYKNYTNDFIPMMNGVPLFEESCVPIKEWQVAYYPTCNTASFPEL